MQDQCGFGAPGVRIHAVKTSADQIGTFGHGAHPRAGGYCVHHAAKGVFPFATQHRQHPIGHRDPQRLGFQLQAQWLVQGFVAQILMVMELQHLVAHDRFVHPHIAEGRAGQPQRPLLL